MVQAIIDITEHTNRVLNVIKARYGLRDKSTAINIMAEQYEADLLEPELKPEYIKKALKISKTKSIHVGTPADLKKMIGLR